MFRYKRVETVSFPKEGHLSGAAEPKGQRPGEKRRFWVSRYQSRASKERKPDQRLVSLKEYLFTRSVRIKAGGAAFIRGTQQGPKTDNKQVDRPKAARKNTEAWEGLTAGGRRPFYRWWSGKASFVR